MAAGAAEGNERIDLLNGSVDSIVAYLVDHFASLVTDGSLLVHRQAAHLRIIEIRPVRNNAT